MYKENANIQIGIFFRGSAVDWWDRHHATPLNFALCFPRALQDRYCICINQQFIRKSLCQKKAACKCGITQTVIKSCSFFVTCFNIHCFKNRHYYYFTDERHLLKIWMEIVLKNAFVTFRKHSVLIIKNRLKAVQGNNGCHS